ncbi:(deoxy)nucleoside triphosphate pyrophosphohydrolase [Mariniluteicoccus endophyticus]
MSEPETLPVVGAIIRRGNTVFAARRRPGRSAGGLWEFPGGKIAPGETPEQALTRELQEELDVHVVVGELASRHVTPLGIKLIDLACYWAELTSDAPTNSTDHDQMRWVPLAQLPDLDWSPADIPIVEDILDGHTQAVSAS